MTEEEAKQLLDKLQDFMENTNKLIELLIYKMNNITVDIEKIKKELKNGKSLILPH